MLPNSEVREVNIKDYILILKKRILVVAGFLLIFPTIIAIHVSIQKPVYRSTASVLIENRPPSASSKDAAYSAPLDVDTQLKVLNSRVLAERIYNESKLAGDPDFRKEADPVGALMSKLTFINARKTNVVLIHADDGDPLRAAAIANAYANGYIQYDIDMRNRAARDASGWMREQLDEVKEKLKEAETELNNYIQKNKIVITSDYKNVLQEKSESLQQKKSELDIQLSEAFKRYKDKHPVTVSLKTRIEEVNAKLEQEIVDMLELNTKMVNYNILKNEVDSNQNLYEALLEASKETGIAEKNQISAIQLLDIAQPDDVPFKPKKKQSIILATLIALFGGIGTAISLEYFDSSIRTAEDISNYINLPFLGYIPTCGKDVRTDGEKASICFQKPTSAIAESFRALRTSIIFSSPEDKPLKSILVTSSIPVEGKSFISLNLAIIFSQMNEKVIFIDGDMRRPKLHKNMNLDNKEGLSTYLIGSAELDAIIKSSPVPGLSVITSGPIPPNPSELLSSTKIGALVRELSSKYERIIIDAPPGFSVADTLLLANIVDGVVLVIKGGSTRLELVLTVKKKIIETKTRIIGTVINNIHPEKDDKYYYYHYSSEKK